MGNDNENTNNIVVDTTDDNNANNNVVMTASSSKQQQPQLTDRKQQSNDDDGTDNENHNNDAPNCNNRRFSNPKLALNLSKNNNIQKKKDTNKNEILIDYLFDDYEYFDDGSIVEGRVYSNGRYFDRGTGLPDEHQYQDAEPITHYSSTKARRRSSKISNAMIDEDDDDYIYDYDYDYDYDDDDDDDYDDELLSM